ncbi:superinfection immunity protein [Leekyejoonella antrihumi]|uniref:Superinfection immunity protein n=2 Tax=Leekyejoonella antrihumi TaxID=1660198 RepID=A0A563EA80_9MICO|nr:superinfection immunity protein [Leekyejoonella antrihumi]
MTQVMARPPVSTAVAVLAWIVAAITLLYMLPWAVAVTRNRSNMAAIGLVNLLLGWSFIGWVVSLVMACGSEPQSTVVVNNYQGPGYPYPGR